MPARNARYNSVPIQRITGTESAIINKMIINRFMLHLPLEYINAIARSDTVNYIVPALHRFANCPNSSFRITSKRNILYFYNLACFLRHKNNCIIHASPTIDNSVLIQYISILITNASSNVSIAAIYQMVTGSQVSGIRFIKNLRIIIPRRYPTIVGCLLPVAILLRLAASAWQSLHLLSKRGNCTLVRRQGACGRLWDCFHAVYSSGVISSFLPPAGRLPRSHYLQLILYCLLLIA
jgi:hypothetical protein